MFVKALRKYRKGFIGLTVLFGLLMAICSLVKMGISLVMEMAELPELGFVLPETEDLLAWAGWAYIALYGAFSVAMGANILGKEMRSGAVSLMALLPVSRGNIVLSHYFAGALYAVVSPLVVGAVTFGALSLQGAAEGIAVSLFAPALGFLLVYSLAFAVAAVVKNAAAPVLTGWVALFAAAFDALVRWQTLPVATYDILDPVTGIATGEILAQSLGNLNGLFAVYASKWSVSIEAVTVGLLLSCVSVLFSIGVYSRKSL